MSHGRRSILRFAPAAGADLTPEKTRSSRARYRADRGMTPSKRNTALIFAGTAMVLGILWVNSGRANRPPIVTSPPRQGGPRAARYRRAGNRRLRGGRAAAEPLGAGGATPTRRCSILQQGFLAPTVRSSRHAAGRGTEQEQAPGQPGRPGATVDTDRLWRARSRWGARAPTAAGLPAKRPTIQERQGGEGRAPNALDFCGKAQP
jgi:type IV secretion system protein VirB10